MISKFYFLLIPLFKKSSNSGNETLGFVHEAASDLSGIFTISCEENKFSS